MAADLNLRCLEDADIRITKKSAFPEGSIEMASVCSGGGPVAPVEIPGSHPATSPDSCPLCRNPRRAVVRRRRAELSGIRFG
jgi:hypothetical protein